MPPAVDISPLASDDVDAVGEDWSAVCSAAEPSPYATFGWVRAWVRTYEPRALALVRVRDERGDGIAIGLLEELSRRRLRFCGLPVTPARGLVAKRGRELDAWDALGGWLREHPRGWSLLDADGLTRAPMGLAGTVVAIPWLGLGLPASFDAYLKQLPTGARGALTRKLRTAERAGVEPVAEAAASARLEQFVELHRRRAGAKGERHEQIDERLIELLGAVAAGGGPAVRTVALMRDGETVAVTIRLDVAATAWFYNAGFDPEASALSPGLVVELASIRDAIERRCEQYDLGPGAYRYKRDLGGVQRTLYSLRATSRSPAGLTLGLVLSIRARAARMPWLRAALGRQA